MSVSGTPDFFYREAQRLGYVARSAFKLLQMQDKYKLIKPGSSVLDLGCAPGAWLQVACQSLGPPKHGGHVLGIDLKKVKVPSSLCDSRVQTVSADVMSLPNDHIRSFSPKHKGFSVILSDMCPLVSGIKTKDAALSTELGMRALNLAVGGCAVDDDSLAETDSCASNDSGILLPGGNLVVKLLESQDMQGGRDETKKIIPCFSAPLLVVLDIHQFPVWLVFADFNRICKPLFRRSSWLRPKATRPSSREIYLICQGFTCTS